MSDGIRIRPATVEDAADILSIYANYIRETTVTFETEVPSVEEFGERIEKVLLSYPWLVCEVNGVVAGYAYASKHGERAAYKWSVDLSIYISKKYQRRNIATALYKALIVLLQRQGYVMGYAGVSVPNLKSEEFHKRFGFQEVGTFENAGYKLGEWRGVKWFAIQLSECLKDPQLPMMLQEAVDDNALKEVLREAAKNIK